MFLFGLVSIHTDDTGQSMKGDSSQGWTDWITDEGEVVYGMRRKRVSPLHQRAVEYHYQCTLKKDNGHDCSPKVFKQTKLAKQHVSQTRYHVGLLMRENPQYLYRCTNKEHTGCMYLSGFPCTSKHQVVKKVVSHKLMQGKQAVLDFINGKTTYDADSLLVRKPRNPVSIKKEVPNQHQKEMKNRSKRQNQTKKGSGVSGKKKRKSEIIGDRNRPCKKRNKSNGKNNTIIPTVTFDARQRAHLLAMTERTVQNTERQIAEIQAQLKMHNNHLPDEGMGGEYAHPQEITYRYG